MKIGILKIPPIVPIFALALSWSLPANAEPCGGPFRVESVFVEYVSDRPTLYVGLIDTAGASQLWSTEEFGTLGPDQSTSTDPSDGIRTQQVNTMFETAQKAFQYGGKVYPYRTSALYAVSRCNVNWASTNILRPEWRSGLSELVMDVNPE